MASVNGPETKVIYTLICSTQCFTIVLCNKHWKLVLTIFHMVVLYKLQSKAVLHARVVKITCCRIVGLMHVDAYKKTMNVLWSIVYPSFSLSFEPEQNSSIDPHIAPIHVVD